MHTIPVSVLHCVLQSKRHKKLIAAGDKEAAASVFNNTVSVIDRIADKKRIHKNKAARHKSRLAAALKAMSAAA